MGLLFFACQGLGLGVIGLGDTPGYSAVYLQ